MQIPYLARHCRVLTFDGRGNGRSDRPQEPAAYHEREFAADALAVMDATGTDRAVLVSLSLGAQRALLLAGEHPDRVDGAVFVCPAVPLGEPLRERTRFSWDEELDTDEGWAKYNRHYWLRDYRGFLEFFFEHMFNEPHSTKPIEDCVGWGLETTAETLVATQRGILDEATIRDLCARVRCPVLVIQGTDDAITGAGRGIGLAAETGGELVLLDGSGHGPHVRDPVKVNLLLRDFIAPAPPPRTWVRGRCTAEAGALRLLPDRPRPRPARRGHRRRTAEAPPRPRDRLARAASRHRRARGARRADPPGQRVPRQRVHAHRERVGRARPALLPGDPADGRDPAGELHGLPRPRPRGAVRPLDRGRGVGARLLPPREPRAEAHALRLADGLRRLAADGGRRRPRGVPHRRLQRGDDRAHRALPARARSGRLRGQPRGHRPRAVRRPPPVDPRVDRGALLVRGLRHAGSIPRTSPTAPRSGRTSATARTSRSASSPSAARASAATSCGVSSPRSPRRSNGSRRSE